MTQNQEWGRYTELRPAELSALRERTPIAYVPWGALAWNGPHLPLGAGGITAEAIAERVARRTGGVLLPTTWWAATAIPHTASLALRCETARALWDDLFNALAAAEWRVVVLISGHYTPVHDLALIAAAESALKKYRLMALALPPLALVDEEMVDQAALWQTSQLLALRGDLVKLDALGQAPLAPAESGVLGRDPRGAASASLGNRALGLAVERIAAAAGQLLADPRPEQLLALYERRRERYIDFLQRHGSDLDRAAIAWWAAQSPPAPPVKP